MSRLVKHTAKKPYVIRLGDASNIAELTSDNKVLDHKLYVCACGLSKNKPFCDGSHHHTEDEREEAVYAYDGEGHKVKFE